MSDASNLNWKEKYLSALEQFDVNQKQDQQRLDLLRRGLVRVSLAADGLDPALDEQLAALRTGLRQGYDVRSLEPTIANLEQAVVALDDRRKDDQAALQEAIDAQLAHYLELSLPRASKSTIKSLRKALPDLLAGNGVPSEVITGLNTAHRQVTEHLLERIGELGQRREGLLARLFGGDKNASDAPGESDAAATVQAAPLENPTAQQAPDAGPAASPPEAPAAASPAPIETAAQEREQDLLQRVTQVLHNLLGNLDIPEDCASRKTQLTARIDASYSLDELPEILDETAQLVASTRMVAQREFEGFLVALHQRLNEIQSFLTSAREGEAQSQRNQQQLDKDVRQELADMRANVAASNDLGQLKLDIESMVSRIVSAVDQFHSQEKQRRDDVYERVEALGQRMASMESEAMELKNSLEAQRLQALRDALTDLPNRAAFDEYIGSEYSRWRRHHRPLSIGVIDVDHFKQINDTLGHLRGDKVLRLVAREINRRMRQKDFVARYGGEEFVVVMPETALESAYVAMDKVRAAVAECPFNFNQQRIPVTVSVGVASFTEGDSIEACFDRADKALYQAKHGGRNRTERG